MSSRGTATAKPRKRPSPPASTSETGFRQEDEAGCPPPSPRKKAVFLVSGDGNVFEVDEAVASCSPAVRRAIEGGGRVGGPAGAGIAFYLPGVKSATLALVIRYLAEQRQEAAATKGEQRRRRRAIESMGPLEMTVALEVAHAAADLEATELFEQAMGSMAEQIRQRSVEYVRDAFSVDFSSN